MQHRSRTEKPAEKSDRSGVSIADAVRDFNAENKPLGGRGKMTSCFVARISNPGERFGKPFYEVDVPSPLGIGLDQPPLTEDEVVKAIKKGN